VWRATDLEEIYVYTKIPRKVFPDCALLRGFVGQNIRDRSHGDPNRRGQLLFGQALTEFSMNKPFQVHNEFLS
jgi:hypothetical protein